MKDEINKQQATNVLKALDEAIENGPWSESNFLRVIGKNLREIRDNFINQINNENYDGSRIDSNLANRVALRSGQQEIFVALYSSEGNSLPSWERIVLNLPRQIISRPIYANEEDIKYLIKSKENKFNEAYLCIYISQNDILPMPADKIPVDKFGKPLISLKDRAINLDNIIRFVHVTGTYTYVKGRLIKNSLTES